MKLGSVFAESGSVNVRNGTVRNGNVRNGNVRNGNVNVRWKVLINISNNQATNRVLYKDFVDFMSIKGFKLIIMTPTHEKMGF